MPTLDTRPDGALVIEADTAAEALAEIGARLGSDAEILSAEKVHRGGWKGFFTREQVQLIARSRGTAPTSPAGAAAPGTADIPTADAPPPAVAPEVTPGAFTAVDAVAAGGLDQVLARMLQQEEDHELAFQQVLARELAMAGTGPGAGPSDPPVDVTGPRPSEPPVDVTGPWPSAPLPAPTEVHGQPVTGVHPWTVPGPAGVGVAWDVDRLRDLRLPAVIIDACEGLDPADDAAWLMTVAAVVSSWCRPLPPRDAVLVGPRAHRLADGLGLDTAGPGDLVAADRSVGLRVTDSAAGRAFVAETRGDRWVHLVAGGSRWQGLLLEDVTAVSWVGDDALPAALEAAARFGLVLGYGISSPTGKRPVRATALDVAITVRSLIPRHA